VRNFKNEFSLHVLRGTASACIYWYGSLVSCPVAVSSKLKCHDSVFARTKIGPDHSSRSSSFIHIITLFIHSSLSVCYGYPF